MPGSTADATEDEAAELTADVVLKEGAVAGLVAGFVMGVVMNLTAPEVLGEAISALYGFRGSLLVGWIAHLLHGLVFGVLFAALLREPSLYSLAAGRSRWIGIGIVYGLVLAIFASGIIMPMWLSAVGFENAPPIPNINGMTILWHAVYGAVLGALFPRLWR